MTNPSSLIKIGEITNIKRGMMMMMIMIMMMTNPTSLIKIGEITNIKRGMMMVMMMMMIMTSRERTDKTRNLEEERIVKNKRTKGNTKVKRGIQQIGNKKGVMEGKKEELKMTAQIG